MHNEPSTPCSRRCPIPTTRARRRPSVHCRTIAVRAAAIRASSIFTRRRSNATRRRCAHGKRGTGRTERRAPSIRAGESARRYGELKWVRDQTRGAKEYRRLDRFLIETIRERLDQAGWAALLVQEARERRAVLEVLKMTGEQLAVAGVDGPIAVQPPPRAWISRVRTTWPPVYGAAFLLLTWPRSVRFFSLSLFGSLCGLPIHWSFRCDPETVTQFWIRVSLH
ncbi:hypothetical protein AWB75_01078 [Caballeronia catudaia]|uniref:Uncharacterized protein n=1 Tax=Caballeronia catudaia TaxID=1777136 RepID=A0A157ZR16_9BURK|nr:hypothetical protein AWB75_01078 [Caballeronia catudaia]